MNLFAFESKTKFVGKSALSYNHYLQPTMYLPETKIPPGQGSWFGLAILTNYQFVTTQYYKINLFKSASVQSLILVRVPTYDVWWSLFSVSGSSRYLSCVVVSILCIWSRRQAGTLTRYEAVLLDTRSSCTKQFLRVTDKGSILLYCGKSHRCHIGYEIQSKRLILKDCVVNP